MKYAGFWVRAVAYIIDGVICGAVDFFSTSFTVENSPASLLVSFLIALGYTAGLTSSHFQGTLGKKILGLKVVDLNGSRISFGKATVRFFASILSGLILGIGFLIVAFNSKNPIKYVVTRDRQHHPRGRIHICERSSH
jgi:uncharacterized RDD family membrane protein YckC